jgi:hypothetical protein
MVLKIHHKPKNMKIGFLITLLITGIHFSTFSQETSEDKIFDYAETKHEFSLDIAPIIQGNYPSSLLYRQHYISKNGKNVALRLGAQLGANVSSTEIQNNSQGSQVVGRNHQSLYVFVGKEWQKQFHPRIIGYYGADLNFGLSRSLSKVNASPSNPSEIINRDHSISIGTIGFLGMKYHFSKHFSVSAETGASLSFNSWKSDASSNNNVAVNQSNNLSLGMIPLRAIRFAFHF